MNVNLTADEWQVKIGRQLRDLRLRRNMDQRQLAEQAAVALNVVKNLEGGKGATVASLIKVLRVLNREEWLDALAPQLSISPLQMLKSRPVRQRASRSKGIPRV